MRFFEKERYTSGVTKFLTQLKLDNPTMEDEQLAGHNRLRNTPPRSRQDVVSEKLARVPQQPYVYHNK